MPSNYQLTLLDSGVRVATLSMPHMESVSIGIWTAVGGRHEPARLNGVSHFIEHLLFKGTHDRTAFQLTAAVEGIGGYINAFTTEDHTCYYAKAQSCHFKRIADVLFDMYTDSLFEEEEIEKERSVIREEILMYRDQPSQHVQEVLSAVMWPDDGLGRPLTGTLKSVESMTRKDIIGFYERNYNAATTVVSVAGKITHEEVMNALRPHLERLRRGDLPRENRARRRNVSGARFAAVDDEAEQVQVAIGFHGCSRREKCRFATKLLSVLLGENMSSRLFQSLRERRGYCYSVNSAVTTFSDTGCFGVQVGLEAPRLKPAIELTWKELRKIAERPPNRRELRTAKDYAIGQNRLTLESTTNQMMWMGESCLGYGKVIDPAQVERQLETVTAEEVQELAADLFVPNRANLAVVGPSATDSGLDSIFV